MIPRHRRSSLEVTNAYHDSLWCEDRDVETLEVEIAKHRYTWTTEKPSKPGWYWYRVDRSSDVWIEQVDRREGRMVTVGLGGYAYIDSYGGEWAGPLPEAKEAS